MNNKVFIISLTIFFVGIMAFGACGNQQTSVNSTTTASQPGNTSFQPGNSSAQPVSTATTQKGFNVTSTASNTAMTTVIPTSSPATSITSAPFNFYESWKSSSDGQYPPTRMDKETRQWISPPIEGDMGTWIVSDTMSSFEGGLNVPECMAVNYAEIAGGKLRLVSRHDPVALQKHIEIEELDPDSSIVENVWIRMDGAFDNLILTENSFISFEAGGAFKESPEEVKESLSNYGVMILTVTIEVGRDSETIRYHFLPSSYYWGKPTEWVMGMYQTMLEGKGPEFRVDFMQDFLGTHGLGVSESEVATAKLSTIKFTLENPGYLELDNIHIE
jgi:hypothetical protein